DEVQGGRLRQGPVKSGSASPFGGSGAPDRVHCDLSPGKRPVETTTYLNSCSAMLRGSKWTGWIGNCCSSTWRLWNGVLKPWSLSTRGGWLNFTVTRWK